MANSIFMKAEEVQEFLGVSRTESYRIIKRLNEELKAKKNYYKTHPCNETFVCKVCGKTVVPAGAGSDHRNQPFIIQSHINRLKSQMANEQS